MYKRILVPVDGSARAERVMPHVESIALRMDSRLTLLQVVRFQLVTDGYLAVRPEETLEQNRSHMEEAQNYLAGIQGTLREKGIEATCRVEQGPVVKTIIRIANLEDAHLIAMSSHGRSGISRAFYGSVASGVLSQVDRPLLIIRARSM